MSYVHCHKCNWSQDDFWSEKYNPFHSLVNNDEKDLLTVDLDSKFPGNPDENGKYKTWREYFVMRIAHMAQRIQNMYYRTREDAKKAGWKCPQCGGKLCED